MMPLRDQLAQCELHTRQAINAGAANRLANWRQYQTEHELVQFIQRAIRNPNAIANGWDLEQQGLTSLESIVIGNPAFFTEEDMRLAMQTLGRQQD